MSYNAEGQGNCDCTKDHFERPDRLDRAIENETRQHSQDTSTLLLSSSETIVLIVGASKTRIACHKALLGYFSGFFEGMLYGNFAESRQQEIELPEDNEAGTGAFVSWAYTGDLLTSHPALIEPDQEPLWNISPNAIRNTPERLWVLGNKLIAPLFANAALKFVRNRYRLLWDPLPTLSGYVYENTLPQAKLRLFMKDLLLTEGPLSEQAKRKNITGSTTSMAEWIDLLQGGGELVGDCLEAFSVPDSKCRPYCGAHIFGCLEPTSNSSALDWITAKQEGRE